MLISKIKKNSFWEIKKPICNIYNPNTFILIFVVTGTRNQSIHKKPP